MTRRGSWEQFHTFIRWNQTPTLPTPAPADDDAIVPVVIPLPRPRCAQRRRP
ncbi:hypothetical protein [Aphanothece minutissima]|uniref:hypothetical protein n=1 Tax=Aphanothece minutissima TaxID=543815 RepID=UPI0015E63ED9|nr:hypothetical protein [Aphanothece minutissima]